MKKILSILGTIGLTTTSTTTLISCEKPNNNENGSNKPEPTPEPQQPPRDSNWKLITDIKNENLQKEINKKNNKWYIAVGKNKRGSGINNSIVKFNSNWDVLTISGNISFGNDNYYSLKNIINMYRWDGTSEPKTPTINHNTGEITDWKVDGLR